MSQLKPLILLIFLGSLFLFITQNGDFVPLYFLNPITPLPIRLPVGVWCLLFTLAGLMTSLFWQGLTRLSGGKAVPSIPAEPPNSPNPKRGKKVRPQVVIENLEDEDEWNIEEPPREPTIPRGKTIREEWEQEEKARERQEKVNYQKDWGGREKGSRKIEEEELEAFEREREKRVDTEESLFDRSLPNYERRQPPRNVSREGTIYSYTYRDPSPKKPKPEQNKPDPENSPVYDVNYRVILPPLTESSRPSIINDQDEEEWV